MAGISQEVGNFSEQVWGVSMSVVISEASRSGVWQAPHRHALGVGSVQPSGQ